jgi:linoleoyl-CoA desaturase
MDIHFKPLRQDIFYQELLGEVNSYFKQTGLSSKADVKMIFKCLFLLLLVVGCYLLLLVGNLGLMGKISSIIILGISVVGLGFNLSHEALHNSFSKKKSLNRFLGYSLDLLGLSSYLWKINHGAHHSFTNFHGADGDIKDSKIVRLCPHSPYHPFHRYQVITILFIYSLFYLLLIYVFNTMNMFGVGLGGVRKIKHTWTEVVKFVFLKALYIFIWLVIPIYVMDLSISEFMVGYLLLSVIIGLIFTSIFALAHTVEAAAFPIPIQGKNYSWAEHQLRTTCNFSAGNKFLELYMGGLNYQIEHHLFPNICSTHYANISPLIKKVAAKHNIPYHQTEGIGSALKSHYSLLWKLSKPPVLAFKGS